jgi:hypothetical protein
LVITAQSPVITSASDLLTFPINWTELNYMDEPRYEQAKSDVDVDKAKLEEVPQNPPPDRASSTKALTGYPYA